MIIELYQGGWYQLIFPIEVNNEPVIQVNGAKLVLYRGPDAVLTLTLNNGMAFANSQITAVLDEIDTVNLVRSYAFELWILDFNNNPLFLRSGTIVFTPTQTRF